VHEPQTLVVGEGQVELMLDRRHRRMQVERIPSSAVHCLRVIAQDHHPAAIGGGRSSGVPNAPVERIAQALALLAVDRHLGDLPQGAQRGKGDVGQRKPDLAALAIQPAGPLGRQQRGGRRQPAGRGPQAGSTWLTGARASAGPVTSG
jgi:hypothetical protein